MGLKIGDFLEDNEKVAIFVGMNDDRLFELLRSALNGEAVECELSAKDWECIYLLSQRQSVTGVLWPVVKDRALPMAVAMQWLALAEQIRGMNELQNREAARLTQLFADAGHRSAILKGQANARLYPDKLLRQPGDIDIWIEGGEESVMQLLMDLGLLDERPTISNAGKKGKATTNYHHVHLPPTKEGIIVEAHFRPSSGNHNPWTNRRLQQWLEQEIKTVNRVEEGFCVPSTRFALVVQLSHIQRHFLSSGIGLRQLCDYYWLLRNASEEERCEVRALLGRFGLRHTAGALMWVLGEVLHLDKALMLCDTDAWRGEWMLREVMAGGNFGHYAERRQKGRWKHFFAGQMRIMRLLRFDFWEALWIELDYFRAIMVTLPERIRRGKLSLSE